MTPVDLLLSKTKGKVYVCSLANGSGGEQHVWTRNRRVIADFCRKWDKPGRGLFFCVSIIKRKPRNKDNAGQSCFLHADIDRKDAINDLKRLSIQPSFIVASGNGTHAYWLLDKAQVIDEGDLKRLCAIVNGDKAVTHRVALMRMPGTHNTKRDAWTLVQQFPGTGKRHSIKYLRKWLSGTTPAAVQRDPLNYFARHGAAYRVPLDVGELLTGMHKGNVHLTQLCCTASMISSGMDLENVVELVLEETKHVKGSQRWNWNREERKIHLMCLSWQRKKDSRND